MTIRSWICLIMGVIEPEQLELLPLNSKNFYVSLCLHCSIYNYQPVSSKLGQNIYDFKMLDEFDYGCNQTRTTRTELDALELESSLE